MHSTLYIPPLEMNTYCDAKTIDQSRFHMDKQIRLTRLLSDVDEEGGVLGLLGPVVHDVVEAA